MPRNSVSAFPMVETCASHQGGLATNTCACGAVKRVGYARCPSCELAAEIALRNKYRLV